MWKSSKYVFALAVTVVSLWQCTLLESNDEVSRHEHRCQKECNEDDDEELVVISLIQTKLVMDASSKVFAGSQVDRVNSSKQMDSSWQRSASAHDQTELSKVSRLASHIEPLDADTEHLNVPRGGVAIGLLAIFAVVFLAWCEFTIMLVCPARGLVMESRKEGEDAAEYQIREDGEKDRLCGLKKNQRVLLCLLLAVVALGVGYATFTYVLGVLLERLISKFDMAFLGVHVTMSDLSLNPFTGVMSMIDLKVSNPAGYHSEYLLRAKSLFIDLDMLPLVCSFFSNIQVDSIKLSGLHAVYERALTTSNIEDLLDNLQRGKSRDSSRRVVLHQVSLTDCWVKGRLNVAGQHGVSLAVPDIHYDDFSKYFGKEGVDTVVDEVLSWLLKSIMHVVTASTS